MSIQKPLYVKIGFVFLAVGLFGLILPFVSFGLSEDYILLQEVAEQKQQQNLQESKPTVSPDLNLSNIKDRLVIAKTGIDMPIFVSTNADTLLKGGWVFPGPSEPGQVGNTVIFGHRFRYLPPISNTFYSLDKIEIGDTFTVAWKGQVYNYIVKEKKIIEPTDFSVLNQTPGKSEITLITCAPLFSTKQRLVIVGDLITK